MGKLPSASGLASRKAELQDLLEESRHEAKELSQAMASLEEEELWIVVTSISFGQR